MRCLLILLCLSPIRVLAELTVVTSIAPLQALTATLMAGTGQPEVLIKSQHSAHHFAFKPSHLQTLQPADMVIWIDRNFESGFQKLPEILPPATVRLELLRLLDLPNQNGHIWYSPIYLRKIVDTIAPALSKLNPAQRNIFEQNQKNLHLAINAWEASTREHLTRQKPRYILDHDFLAHFEAYFQVKALASLTDDHGQHRGIKTLKTIEQILTQTPAKCLLANENSISKLGRNLSTKYNLAVHTLTVKKSAEPGEFMQSLHRLSDALEQCK